MEQEIETCTVKINLLTATIYVICICRSPTGNFVRFIENCYKQQLDALLATYNLISSVQFSTRSLNGSISTIDISHKGKYTLYPLINGLSDHDRQTIQLENISMKTQSSETRILCKFNKYYIHDFKTKLSYEIWDTIFGDNDVNKIFNNLHNTFLRIFYSSFPKNKIQVQKKDSTWMSKGIKISINHKRELYLSSRNSKNPEFKEHYKSYCKLLSKVIKEAKILQYKKQILTTFNKTRTTWNTAKSKTGKKKRGKEKYHY
jgi:hypothetical protein